MGVRVPPRAPVLKKKGKREMFMGWFTGACLVLLLIAVGLSFVITDTGVDWKLRECNEPNNKCHD